MQLDYIINNAYNLELTGTVEAIYPLVTMNLPRTAPNYLQIVPNIPQKNVVNLPISNVCPLPEF